MQAAIISLTPRASIGTSSLMRARKAAATDVVFSEKTYPANTEFSGHTIWSGTESNIWKSKVCLTTSDGKKILARLAIHFDENASISSIALTQDDGQVHFSKGHH